MPWWLLGIRSHGQPVRTGGTDPPCSCAVRERLAFSALLESLAVWHGTKSPSFSRLSVLFHEVWVSATLTRQNPYEDEDLRTEDRGFANGMPL